MAASDIMEEAVQHTNNALQREAPQAHVSVVQGKMTQIEQPSSTFDLVIAFNVVYHALREQVDNAMEEIFRILKPGGFAFVTFLSKDWSKPFTDPVIAERTTIRQEDPEKGVPHFWSNKEDVAFFTRHFSCIYSELREENVDIKGKKLTYPSYHYRLLVQKP